ncbi:hypothetical protein ZOSMA_187G00200 [Zostera marina]|uniref:Uncharacterized protein n=1 Tax=Zostera marina TaxID=29655 RepID=A0A0K9PSF9_ZOSMR|nr:hypothetical protein ZOSMA_187G00200 [Zostera marina]
MAEFSPDQIGAILFPMSASRLHFQSVEERKRLLESSPFPLHTMDDVVADTLYTLVLTHTFFPANTLTHWLRHLRFPRFPMSRLHHTRCLLCPLLHPRWKVFLARFRCSLAFLRRCLCLQ